MKKTISLVFLALLFLSTIAYAAPTTIEIQPNDITVEPEETFTVSLYVVPGETINTVATDRIYWDPDALECLKIERGDLFPDAVVWITGTIHNDEGTIQDMVWGSQQRTNTSGVFCTIQFRAKTGTTTITIDPTFYGVANDGNSLEKEIISGCTVHITGDGTIITPSVIEGNTLYIIILVVGIIAACVAIAFFLVKNRSKKPKKEEKEKEETEKDEDGIFT